MQSVVIDPRYKFRNVPIGHATDSRSLYISTWVASFALTLQKLIQTSAIYLTR